MPSSSVTPVCPLPASPELYGPGLRVSYYLTYASGLVALLTHQPNAIVSARRGLNLITLAVLVETVIDSVGASAAAHALEVEWFLVFSLVIVLPLCVLFPWSLRGAKGGDPLGVGMFVGLVCAFGLVQPWLYFDRLGPARQRQGDDADAVDCDVRVWVFYTAISTRNPHWVAFTKAAAVLLCVAASGYAGFAVWLLAYGVRKGLGWVGPPRAKQVWSVHPDATLAIESEPVHVDEAWGSSWTSWSLVQKGVVALVGTSTIASIEKTIRLNDLDLHAARLSDTSQLIPLLVGILGLFSVVWNVVKTLAGRRREMRRGRGPVDWETRSTTSCGPVDLDTRSITTSCGPVDVPLQCPPARYAPEESWD